MPNTEKLEIYIPIEIKPREFISQLLLSGELAKLKMRVYLGSKKAIDNLVESKNNKTGIYLYKGGGSTINKFKKLSQLVSSIAVLDQEISPAFRDYQQIKNRFVKGSLKFVSRLYYVGPEAKKSAREVLDDIDHSKIKSFGWPRIDIWEPALHYIWEEDIKKIKSKYPKPFLFFCSDFGCNTKDLVKERCLWVKNRGAKKSFKDIKWHIEFYEKNYKRYIEFIDYLDKLNSDPEIPNIIIRPHPSEDHSAWERKVCNFKNINLTYEGDVSPWLLASEGLLHRGCTTAIEAAISRKKIAFLTSFSSDHENVSALISTKINDIQSLKIWINKNNSIPIDNPVNLNLLKKHATFSEQRAVSRIAKDILTLTSNKVPPSHLNTKENRKKNLFRIKKLIGRLIHKIFKKKNYGFKFIKKNKMQDGINLNECNYYISLMYPEYKFNIENPSSELIKIESLN